MSDNKTSFQLAGDVLSVEAAEETVLLSYGAGKYFGVKGAIRHLLEGLRDGMSFDDMISATCARYDVGREDAKRDLEAILPKLVAAGIIETK